MTSIAVSLKASLVRSSVSLISLFRNSTAVMVTYFRDIPLNKYDPNLFSFNISDITEFCKIFTLFMDFQGYAMCFLCLQPGEIG